MTEPTGQPRRRTGTIVLIAVLAAAIIAAVTVGIVSAATPPHSRAAGTPVASGSHAPGPAASASPAPASSSAAPKAPPTDVHAGGPQPTSTAAISKPAVIVRALTARVTNMESVIGKAEGPGEVGGPSVRFTITLTNHTGKTVGLSNTVVNAFYGKGASPAVPLELPGGAPFPASVPDGSSATGTFVFNIPTAARSLVEVTVDTSVKNPVVAFRGAAPQ